MENVWVFYVMEHGIKLACMCFPASRDHGNAKNRSSWKYEMDSRGTVCLEIRKFGYMAAELML